MRPKTGDQGHLAVEVAAENAGLFHWDIVANTLCGDASFAAIFGFEWHEVDGGLPVEAFIARMHPEDRERIARSIHYTILSGASFTEQYRIVHPDGREISVLALSRCFCRRDGLLTNCSGVLFNLSGHDSDMDEDGCQLEERAVVLLM